MASGFTEQRRPEIDGSALISFETDEWLVDGDIAGRPLVIVVHGLMGNQDPINKLASRLNKLGFCIAAFVYDTGKGIDVAAQALERRIDERVESVTHGFALVGHSLGGLVARKFEHGAAVAVREKLRGVVVLGSPHGGLPDEVTYLGTWYRIREVATGRLSPFGQKLMDQLTGKDPDKLLEVLNGQAPRTSVPHLSISGGRSWLNFHRPVYMSRLWNNRLQALIGERPNDGLLAESITDLCRRCGRTDATHRRDYAEFAEVDHFHLMSNQEVSEIVSRWLKRLFVES